MRSVCMEIRVIRKKSADDYAEPTSISLPRGLKRACDERRSALGFSTLSEYFKHLARYDTQRKEEQVKFQIVATR
jgi:hypothetical protein